MKALASLGFVAVSLALFGTAVSACSTAEPGDKEAVGEASQDISKGQLNVVGSLAYGETSKTTPYAAPRYAAFKFAANEGDEVDIWVKSKNGDPVAWILDSDFKILALNDDASAKDTSSHIKATLPANESATHYVVVRDYYYSKMTFTVSLDGKGGDPAVGCNVDADCVRVDKTCCALGQYTAVLASKKDAFHASLDCVEPQMCPMIMPVDDHSVAECNVQAHRCELVKPKDIACGGFMLNSHSCPDGYRCQLPVGIADVPGKCVQSCGGIAAIPCTDATEECVDDPTDDCDPNKGADCGGVCAPKKSDCRVNGCGANKTCSLCWGSYACVPNGALC